MRVTPDFRAKLSWVAGTAARLVHGRPRRLAACVQEKAGVALRGLISSVPFLGSALVMLEEGAMYRMYRRIGIIVAAAAMGMLVDGTSAQAVTSVTATLRNSSPQFVALGNPGAQQPIAVLGTLKNVSVGPTPPPPPLKCPPTCEGLHSFTIQIPFLTNTGTLYCSMGNAYQPGTCSVSNNVLTVTQNFTFPQPFRWLPGHSEQIGYVYVGASQLDEFVTWGTPTVTAAN
jgi:hypothetical protein